MLLCVLCVVDHLIKEYIKADDERECKTSKAYHRQSTSSMCLLSIAGLKVQTSDLEHRVLELSERQGELYTHTYRQCTSNTGYSVLH